MKLILTFFVPLHNTFFAHVSTRPRATTRRTTKLILGPLSVVRRQKVILTYWFCGERRDFSSFCRIFRSSIMDNFGHYSIKLGTVFHMISRIPKMVKKFGHTIWASKSCTFLKAYILVSFSHYLIKLGHCGPYDLKDSKHGKKIGHTIGASKSCTNLKAYILASLGHKSIKLGHSAQWSG